MNVELPLSRLADLFGFIFGIELGSRSFRFFNRIELEFFKFELISCQFLFDFIHFFPKLLVSFFLVLTLFEVERDSFLLLSFAKPFNVLTEILEFLQFLLARFTSLLQARQEFLFHSGTNRKAFFFFFPVFGRDRVPCEGIWKIRFADRKIFVEGWEDDVRDDASILCRLTIRQIKFLNGQLRRSCFGSASEEIVFQFVNRLNSSFSMSRIFTENNCPLVAFQRSGNDFRS